MIPLLTVFIGSILIILNLKAIKKEEKRFSKILEKEEYINNKDYDLEILSIRKDMAETVFELQKEIEDLKIFINKFKESETKTDNINKIDYLNKTKLNIEKDIISEKDFSKEDIISEINFSNKIKHKKNQNLQSEKQIKVKLLLDKGLTEDEICEELSIGKGEVLLIKNLLKK